MRGVKVKNRSNGIKAGLFTIIVVHVAEYSSSASSEGEAELTSDCLGHCSKLSFSQSGPFHRRSLVKSSKGYIARDAQSAGLS